MDVNKIKNSLWTIRLYDLENSIWLLGYHPRGFICYNYGMDDVQVVDDIVAISQGLDPTKWTGMQEFPEPIAHNKVQNKLPFAYIGGGEFVLNENYVEYAGCKCIQRLQETFK
mgnify:CR=1 FL=1